VVEAPVGAVVSSLPEERTTVQVDGEDHLEFNGVTYRPFFRDGVVVYRVVEA
jgi:hypothetical protein